MNIDQLIEQAVLVREKGRPDLAIKHFLDLEKQAIEEYTSHNRARIMGHRIVCYLLLAKKGSASHLKMMIETSWEGIRLSSSLRGEPEMRTFRFRLGQAYFLQGKYELAVEQIRIALKGLRPNDLQHFQFASLYAVAQTKYAKFLIREAHKHLGTALKTVAQWREDHKDNGTPPYQGLIHHSGVILKIAEFNLDMNRPAKAAVALHAAETIATELSRKHSMRERLNEVKEMKQRLPARHRR